MSNSSSESPYHPPRLLSPHRTAFEDQIHCIISKLESDLLQLFQINFVEDDIDFHNDTNILQGPLDRCIFPSDHVTDVHTDAFEMSQGARNFITGLLGQNPI